MRIKNTIWTAVLVAAGMVTAASGAVRDFEAKVVAVDPAKMEVSVEHLPTGYRETLTWNEQTRFTASRVLDVDTLDEGTPIFIKALEVYPEIRTIKLGWAVRVAPERAVSDKVIVPERSMRGVARLRRVEPFDTDLVDELTTQDGSRAYVLDLGGEPWRIQVIARPLIEKHNTKLEISELHEGMLCDVVEYNEADGRILRLNARIGFEHNVTAPAVPSGVTVDQLAAHRENIRKKAEPIAVQLRKTMPVRFSVRPRMVLEGEPVAVDVEALAAKRPNPQAMLRLNQLMPGGTTRPMELDWREAGEELGLTRYVATAQITDLPPGQHLMTWQCDIGGDIEEFERSIAVATPNSLVVSYNVCRGGPVPTPLIENRLPYAYWDPFVSNTSRDVADRGEGYRANLRLWSGASRDARRVGADPIFLNIRGRYYGKMNGVLPRMHIFSAEAPELQREVIALFAELAAMMGYPVEQASMHGYEMGSASVQAARDSGLCGFAGLCDYQNFSDGAWKINVTGRPAQPYYASNEDFRKPTRRSKAPVFITNQTNKGGIHRQEYMFGVFDACLLDRRSTGAFAGGRNGRLEVDDIYMSRLYDVIDAQIQLSETRRAPWVLDIGFQDAPHKWGDITTTANRLWAEYCIRKAQDGADVVFASQSMIRDFYLNHYEEIPEHIDYAFDFNCGTKAHESVFTVWKPVTYPDLMSLEGPRYTVWFKRNEGILPVYHYDYTKQWDYPDWGNEDLHRSHAGALVPGTFDKFAMTPAVTDTRGIQVQRSDREGADGTVIEVRVQSDRAHEAFPLALWDIPREWAQGDAWWTLTKGKGRFVPVRAPYTHNLNGILEVDLQAGENVYELHITTPERELESMDLDVGLVHGKVIERDGQAMAYLWPMRPWNVEIELNVPAGRSVQFYAAPEGERVDLNPGTHSLTIPKERWVRVVGMTHAELEQFITLK